jgi:hypothetical protein
MITYDLRCIEGHLFEVRFRNRDSYLDQRERGLVECPHCGSTSVEVAFTGCSVHTGRKRAPHPEDSLLRRMQEFLERNFDDVGEEFAREARRIHRGQAEKRNIRGLTTEGEEESLREEGIAFLKLPLPRLDD